MQQNLKVALKGLGAAGQARLQAIHEIPGMELGGVVSRRSGVGTLSWQEALGDPKIQAIAISTENTDHPSSVADALRADKHVLCDFPLALTEAQARELFALARKQKRVLHVEHLGLLTEDHQRLKEQIKEQGPLKKGDYLFQGGWNEKLADSSRTGPYSILAVSRLLQVADLFGPFRLETREARVNSQGLTLHFHLHFKEGGTLGFTEERKLGLPRKRSLIAELAKGSVTWRPGTGERGLFAQDLAWFRDRVLMGKPCYYDEELMIRVIGELEKVAVVTSP